MASQVDLALFFADTGINFENVLPHAEAGVETGFCLRCSCLSC